MPTFLLSELFSSPFSSLHTLSEALYSVTQNSPFLQLGVIMVTFLLALLALMFLFSVTIGAPMWGMKKVWKGVREVRGRAKGFTGRCDHDYWSGLQNSNRSKKLCSACKVRLAMAEHDAAVAHLRQTRAILADIMTYAELSKDDNE